MRRFTFIMVLFLLIFIFPVITFGNDYFAYDLEEGVCLFMGDQDTSFSKKINMVKKPDLMMATFDPQKYLALSAPKVKNEEQESKSQSTENQEKEQAGGLVLFNIETGRTEDLIELGFAPFNWDYTPDHKHFFVTYKKTSDDDSTFELLHYDIAKMTVEKVTLPDYTKKVTQITVLPDLTSLYLLIDNEERVAESDADSHTKGQPALLTFGYDPLEIKNTMSLEISPTNLYALSSEQLVLVCQDWNIYTNYYSSRNPLGLQIGNGSIRLIDTKDYKTVEEYEVKKSLIATKWYKDEKVLIATCWKGSDTLYSCYVFLKVTSGSMEIERVNDYNDYEYLTDKDQLCILTPDSLLLHDYKANTTNTGKTGKNMYKSKSNYFIRIPDSNIGCIYSYQDGKVKFVDLNENKVLSKVFSGRPIARVYTFFGRMFGFIKAADPMITASPDKSKYFVYNRITNDITVYDRDFKLLKYITTSGEIYGIYQIKKPVMQTLVFTGKRVYRLDPENLTLTKIHEYKQSSEEMHIYEEENRTLIDSDTELLVIDPATLEVISTLNYYTDSKTKYSKLRPGEQRYYFIETL